MDSISHVVKSKSSNSAITSKSADKKVQKSSGSSFAIQRNNQVKKRGVYVEKKTSKNEPKKEPTIPSRPQPRPHSKNFLSSVLNILSKSTTGTQYPDDPKSYKNSDVNIRYCHSPKNNSRRAEVATLQMVTKKNYRRRKNNILNRKGKLGKLATKEEDKTAVIVLQPKRQIIQTPSNYSEKSYKDMTDPVIWNKLPCLVNYTDSAEYVDDTEVFDQNLCTQVCNEESQRARNIEIRKKAAESVGIGVKKSDKALYNFFVDLLQTTISVYNMKPEYENHSQSNVRFEIEEEVANKLNVHLHDSDTFYTECLKKGLKHTHSEREELEDLLQSTPDVTDKSFRKIFSPVRSNVARKNVHKNPIVYNTPNRHISRKSRKRRFISLLKKELQMKDNSYEEPQTLYDALKVIAKTKRKEARSVRSNPVSKPSRDTDCKFDINRRRNIMTPDRPTKRKKTSEKSHKNFKKNKANISRRARKELEILPLRETYQIPKKPLKSLEVIGFDYQQPKLTDPIPEEDEVSSGSSDTTVCDRSAFETEWGDQSSKYEIYNNWICGKGGPPWSDLKSYIFADDDDEDDDQ